MFGWPGKLRHMDPVMFSQRHKFFQRRHAQNWKLSCCCSAPAPKTNRLSQEITRKSQRKHLTDVHVIGALFIPSLPEYRTFYDLQDVLYPKLLTMQWHGHFLFFFSPFCSCSCSCTQPAQLGSYPPSISGTQSCWPRSEFCPFHLSVRHTDIHQRWKKGWQGKKEAQPITTRTSESTI